MKTLMTGPFMSLLAKKYMILLVIDQKMKYYFQVVHQYNLEDMIVKEFLLMYNKE